MQVYNFNHSLPEPNAVIFHVDMNAYFASVEQACNPFLQGKPVAIVPSLGYPHAAILARSYQAKARGVATFSRVSEAKLLCPELICVPSDHLKYYDVNNRIHKIISKFTDRIEIYSIDEFFLDLTDYFALRPQVSYVEVAQAIKAAIAKEIHPVLTCSIGVGPNKLLAKVGSDFKKPDGLTIIDWQHRHDYLDSMELGDIWGIGRNCVPKLHAMGARNLRDVRGLSIELLKQTVGSYWTRLLQIANGEHYEAVSPERQARPQKTMEHAHTMSEATSDEDKLRKLIRKLAERLGVRLRKQGQVAGAVTLGMRPQGEKNYGWGRLPRFYGRIELPIPTNTGWDIYSAAAQILPEFPLHAYKARLLVVGVDKLQRTTQLHLLKPQQPKLQQVSAAFDAINRKYGEFTIRTADILHERAKERELTVPRKPMTFHPS